MITVQGVILIPLLIGGMILLNIIINNEDYFLIKDYKENDKYRHSLNRLTQQTYGFDFEQWYQQGYWGDLYRPYSLLHNDEIVANVSVNPIEFLMDGKLCHTVQLGTVMTDKAYRHKGLSKALMNIVLKEYEESCELIYLYANDSVLEFYPKFGFVEAEEYVHSKLIKASWDKFTVRKLDRKNTTDNALLTRLVTNTVPSSSYAMRGNPGLVMFYLTSFLSEDIYYIEELELAAVVAYEEENLILTDLFCEHEFDLDAVINSLIDKPERKVILGFTPPNNSAFVAERLKEEGTTFFVKGKNLMNQGKFPVLSHA
jgi:GNAT superfamily N-acetyltransferase